MRRLFYFFLFPLLLFVACNDYTPKPSGFLRIDLPAREYTTVDTFDSFQLALSDQAMLSKTKQKDDQEVYFNLLYPQLGAEIFCSYFPISKESLSVHAEESRRLAYLHTLKADAIQEKMYSNQEQNVYGLVYYIQGNVASPTQFVLTDSVKSFFRGALYFNNTPNQDSIAPVLDYINQDIQVLIESFRWKQ